MRLTPLASQDVSALGTHEPDYFRSIYRVNVAYFESLRLRTENWIYRNAETCQCSRISQLAGLLADITVIRPFDNWHGLTQSRKHVVFSRGAFLRNTAEAGFPGKNVQEKNYDVQHNLHPGQTLLEEDVSPVVQRRQDDELSD